MGMMVSNVHVMDPELLSVLILFFESELLRYGFQLNEREYTEHYLRSLVEHWLEYEHEPLDDMW